MSMFGGVPVDQEDVQPKQGGSRFGGVPLDQSQRPAQDHGIGQTAMDQYVSGATLGFGNHISDALGAVGAKVYDKTLGDNVTDGQSISDLYSDARKESQQRLSDEMATRPALSVGSQIVGGLATGGAVGGTKAGAAIGNSLRTGGLGARIGKGLLAGAASGAAYGAGTADEGKMLSGAENGAVTGALVGGAIPGAGAALSDVGSTIGNAARGLLAKSPEAVQDAASSMKGAASGLYDQMRSVGATLNQSAANNLSNNLDAALSSKQFIPQLNPKTMAVVQHIKDAAAQGDIGIGDLDQYRRLLGRIAPTEDGVSAGVVRKAIDDTVNGLQGGDLSNGSTQAISLLNQGRKQYQQASKFEDVADILTKADGDPNKIKSGLTRFLNNPDNTTGWNADELSALKDAASGSGTEKLLKMGGKFGFDLGNSLTMGNGIGPVIAGLAEGPIAPVAGTAARYGQKLAARGKAQQLLDVLQNGGAGKSQSTPVSGLLSAPAGAGAAEYQSQPPAQIPAPKEIPVQMPPPRQQMQMQPRAQIPSTPDVSSFAQAESGGDPNAQSKTSSASGLFQFTNKTWADMVAKYGNQTGIKFADKNNPQAQATMAGLLAKDNVQSLQNTLGRMPTKGELYMAHVLGAGGASSLIKANPSQEAITLFPRNVSDANRSLFFNGRQPRSVAELQQLLASKV